MSKPLEKNSETCPMLARSDWGVGHFHQKGLTHALSTVQSSVGFNGPRVAGWLVFLNGCHRGEDMRLPVGESKLGSSWLSDLVLTGIGIASQHVVFRMGVGEGKIIPIATERVVKVDNQVITQAVDLVDGCLITVGELHCVFRFAEQRERGYQPSASPRPTQIPIQASHRETVCGWFVITKGSMLGQDFRLINGKCRLGSEVGSEITIADTHLPRHALTLSVTTKECRVAFVNPEIKLLVNGVEASSDALLKESDTIVLNQLEGYIKWFLA